MQASKSRGIRALYVFVVCCSLVASRLVRIVSCSLSLTRFRQITAVHTEHKSAHVQFVDGDCERERSVALKYIRRRPDDERALRKAEFEKLQATWKQPIVCAAEVARLEAVGRRHE